MNETSNEKGSRQLLTVGHSNLPIEGFVRLLAQHHVTCIADVRSQPYSQFNPQFNRETLEQALRVRQIKYVFLGEELGARRGERECYVAGKARYDRIVSLPRFLEGIERVKRGMQTQRIALMCSEKDPITCHRTILICRYLRTAGVDVRHILEDGLLETQAAAEDRLLKLMGLPEADLFHGRGELVEQAYDLQAELIAYVETPQASGQKAAM